MHVCIFWHCCVYDCLEIGADRLITNLNDGHEVWCGLPDLCDAVTIPKSSVWFRAEQSHVQMPGDIYPGGSVMQSITHLFVSGLVVMPAVGCASTKVTDCHRLMGTQKIANPDRISVDPFAPTLLDILS